MRQRSHLKILLLISFDDTRPMRHRSHTSVVPYCHLFNKVATVASFFLSACLHRLLDIKFHFQKLFHLATLTRKEHSRYQIVINLDVDLFLIPLKAYAIICCYNYLAKGYEHLFWSRHTPSHLVFLLFTFFETRKMYLRGKLPVLSMHNHIVHVSYNFV